MHNERQLFDLIIKDSEELAPKIFEPPKLNFSYCYTIGIDLGRLRDQTVITTVMSHDIGGKKHHVVVDIQTVNVGLDFPAQSQSIVDYHNRPHFRTWDTKTLIDKSGLGLPVCDYLKADYPEFKFRGVTITAGEKKWSRNWLIRNVIKWISKPSFYISTDIELSQNLKDEIQSIKMDHRKDGSVFYETATEHDDYLMSLALALAHLESKERIRGGSTNIWFDNVYNKCVT